MWNDVRKSYRSPQKTNNVPQRLSTTCLITPAKGQKPTVRQSIRQCPLHFCQPSHICLTCRKSICLRCALTYCKQHLIRSESQVMIELRQQVLRLEISPKVQQLQVKLQQSQQRQEYLQKKILKLIQSIQNHFDYIGQMLNKKKLQIIEFYDKQFQKYLQEHRNYDIELQKRIEWLKQYNTSQQIYKIDTIQDIDILSNQIKKSGQEDFKMQKKITKMLMGKDKIRIQKLWSQQNMQKVLYEIEQIPFKLEQKSKNQKGKKRVTTENAMEITYNPNNIKFIKSSNNSRYSSGRKIVGT